MNTLNWGRKRNSKSIEKDFASQKKFKNTLLFGIAVCLLFTLTLTNDLPEYISVFSPVSSTENHNESTTADPFGYFNGKWNLWEYLGDAFASIFE